MATYVTVPAPPASTARGFVPALDGMRGLAAMAVVVTHVAFQTGSVDGSWLGAVWGRFDMAVAVFFALSGYLLWRPHAEAARNLRRKVPTTWRYLRHRVVRIWPAYVVVVVVVVLGADVLHLVDAAALGASLDGALAGQL